MPYRVNHDKGCWEYYKNKKTIKFEVTPQMFEELTQHCKDTYTNKSAFLRFLLGRELHYEKKRLEAVQKG